jgi:hypothetical protein
MEDYMALAKAYYEHAAEWDGRWLSDLAILASKDGYRIGSARMRTADERVVITWEGVEALGCDGPADLAHELEATEPPPWWLINEPD